MRLTNYPEISSIRQTRTVPIRVDTEHGPREIELTINDLPPTYAQELEAAVPTPQPPRVGPMRDGKNKIVFNQETGRPYIEYDERNPKYLAELQEAQTLQMVFSITQGVAPGQIQFEAQLNGSDQRKYLREVLTELKDFGFGIGTVKRISDALRELSNISDDDLATARQDFSSAETSASAS